LRGSLSADRLADWSGASDPDRLLIYSQDGLGLGHMRRTYSIASEFLDRFPESAVLTIHDSPLGNPFKSPPNHDYVKLPSINKVGPGDWRAVSLPLRVPEVLEMRAELIRSIVGSFRPDVLLVDHMPHGAMGELRPALEALEGLDPRPKVVLGLRDIIDAPAVVARRWLVEGAFEAIDRFYDLVLVYGSREVFDFAAEYRLPHRVAAKIRYCGFVCTQARARYAERVQAQFAGRSGGLLVAMAGGGADGFPLMRSLLEAIPIVRSRQDLEAVLITGPMMPAAQRRTLLAHADDLGVVLKTSVSDPLSYIAAADVVVAMAGYNTTMEIIRSSTPALIVPRAGPSAEQRTRAHLFQERGWVAAIDPDELSPEALAEAIVSSLGSNGHPHPRSSPDLSGLTRAVDEIANLLTDAFAPAALSPTSD
jgi:predicted glycosyltransferase